MIRLTSPLALERTSLQSSLESGDLGSNAGMQFATLSLYSAMPSFQSSRYFKLVKQKFEMGNVTSEPIKKFPAIAAALRIENSMSNRTLEQALC